MSSVRRANGRPTATARRSRPSGARTTSASSTRSSRRPASTLLEHDGSYPGDVDVTARPPLQKGDAGLALGAVADHHRLLQMVPAEAST